MAQDGTRFKLSDQKARAAYLLAEDLHNDGEIAAQVGISRRTLARWKAVPEFAAQVEEDRKKISAAIRASGLADRTARLRQLKERHQRLVQVMQERAQDPDLQAVPGGRSGLLVRHLTVLRVKVWAVMGSRRSWTRS